MQYLLILVVPTLAEEKKKLEKGDTRLFYAILTGNAELAIQALDEDAALNRPLDQFLGEMILQLARPYIDFPICPPTHFAFNYGYKNPF
jgi:hypothetical protein